MTNHARHVALDPEAAQNLFRNMFEQFIGPELTRRIEANVLPKDVVVRKFQVLFSADGLTSIEINDEAEIQVAYADPDQISSTLERGAELDAAEMAKFGRVVRIEPTDQRHADSGFICAAYVRDGEWAIGFDFRVNLSRAERVATTASDYLEIARNAEQTRKYAPLVDNLYAAYELACKALLWTHPRGYKFTDKMKKGQIQEEFFAATEARLFPKPWATAFRELWELRNPNRYAYEGAKANWKAVPRWLEYGAEIVAAAEALGVNGRLMPDLDAPLERG